MNWTVEVKPSAEKQYRKLEKKAGTRVLNALRELESMQNPMQHKDMRPLTGSLKGDWRLRVGELRVLITPQEGSRTLMVYAVLPRGSAY